MSKLPSLKEVKLDAEGASAWSIILDAEKEALRMDTHSSKYKDNLIGIRVLGCFLQDFLNTGGNMSLDRFPIDAFLKNSSLVIPRKL